LKPIKSGNPATSPFIATNTKPFQGLKHKILYLG